MVQRHEEQRIEQDREERARQYEIATLLGHQAE